MYLKTVELLGFKSFTEKTVIKLNQGISCIVGPNGSGKSNIADAIRWVLGEQSARSLRGQKMEDVIFSGSNSRKAVGMAEVVLTLDNSDGSLPLEYTEVAICRRTYRSGESEYLINGNQCRLKDIQELFVDSGVGNGGIALIGQGRVHEIVTMKPEERRSLIEEAAGIVRYRNRKRTALKKLADTERNLERIGDIINELGDRVEPLAEQAVKAEKYLAMTNEADKLEVNLLVQVMTENKDKLDKLALSSSETKDKLLQIRTDKSKNDTLTEELKSKLAQEEILLAEAQKLHFDLLSRKERAEANLELLNAKKATAAENIGRISQDIADLLNRDDGFVSQVNNIEQEKDELAVNIEQQKTEIESEIKLQEEAKAYLDELSAQIDLSKNEAFEEASQLANSRNELNYQLQDMANMDTKLQALSCEIKEIEENSRTNDELKNRYEERLQTIAADVKNNNAAIAELDAASKAREAEIQALAEKEVMARYQLNSAQSRLNMLQELESNYDGYYPGVKAVLQAQARKEKAAAGTVGVIAELIKVEEKYGMAVEVALGANLQNVVTVDDTAAKAAISYLKKNKLGRATFLPLANIMPKTNPNFAKVMKQKGVIGLVSDVVKVNPKLKPALDFLLGKILLVENLDVATEMAKILKQQGKIVTLDGDFINTGGSISGGSRQKRQGDLLSRKTQIHALTDTLAALKQDIEEYGKQLAILRGEDNEAALDKDDILLALRNLEMERIALQKDIMHLNSGILGQAGVQKDLLIEREELNTELERLLNRRGELEKEVEKWEEKTAAFSAEIAALQQEAKAKMLALDTSRQVLEERKIALAKAEQVYNNLFNEIQRLKNEKKDLFQQDQDKKEELAEWQAQAEALDRELQEIKDGLLKLAEELLAAEENYHSLQNKVAADKANLEQLNKTEHNLIQALNDCQNEIHQQELKEARLVAEWENQKARLYEGFAMAYEESLGYLDTSISRRELNQKVKELRAAIIALGNVNLDAIDEYAQVKERFDFLTAQSRDLVEAKDALNKVIKEIDHIMVNRFREAFEAVNHEFNITFNRLFGGGRAGLVMTEPENLLETGIDMMVEPPGKKIVNYNLLSGGEKSLIGIALILAVFQVHPSPFCVLDEVDAALDEANVDRFAAYLRDFVENTQFIVISHRQGTMEIAQALWGITMNKEGISKVVSVRLKDVEQVS